MVHLGDECPVLSPLLPYINDAEQWSHDQIYYHPADVTINTLVAVVLLVASLALLFFGRKLIYTTFFVSGFIVALVATAYLVNLVLSATHPSTTLSCVLLIGLPLLCGLLGGYGAVKWFKRAFVLVGLAAGGAGGYWCYLVLHTAGWSVGTQLWHNDLSFYICLVGGAVLGAVAMVYMREVLLIVATSVTGAVGLVPALAVLALGRINPRFLWILNASGDDRHRKGPYVFGQVVAALVYFALGVLVQRAQQRREQRSSLRQSLINARR